MHSLRELFRIGMGPSSSHTMAPSAAAARFRERNPDAASFRVTLYGSLAATGRGHLTDRAILRGLGLAGESEGSEEPEATRLELLWKADTFPEPHPNRMDFTALDRDTRPVDEWTVYSVGGGALLEADELESPSPEANPSEVYSQRNMDEIIAWTAEQGNSLGEFVFASEDEKIAAFLEQVWGAMQAVLTEGAEKEGVLPGGLGLTRRARIYYIRARQMAAAFQRTGLVAAYALAVAEENASGGTVVTAPTCGSAGVLPAVLRYQADNLGSSEEEILRALAVAGLVGNVVKHNASISGAEVGCQGEVGTACAMAAAAAAQLSGGTVAQIEYAAEMGLEHHLGLTCDPVGGLVQIPCIERNAMAALQALSCAEYALLSDGRHRISFDEVVQTMLQTGHDIKHLYRETGSGGLARFSHLRTV